MFGIYKIPFQTDAAGITVSVECEGETSTYRRIAPLGTLTKRLGYREGRVFINPVEPVNLPSEVTGMLEFHFTPVTLRPGSSIPICMKFPVEIGVFVGAAENYTLLDVFSLARPKYSLYGTPEKGFITRHVECEVYEYAPPTNPFEEGVLFLTIKNSARDWVEVSRAVFDASMLRIFHGRIVAITGEMEVYSRLVAETSVLDLPPEDGMKQSLRVFPTKRMLIPEKQPFMMEYGVGD
ncbi:MAG: hypothetical protein A4E37_00238 [Methanoregulaceae archaeon PtaB.Bin056]|nr:MAG: hypothetical protein A4E37_00238 [Methanoregulaceae archaeon PtaB.Bin056]